MKRGGGCWLLFTTEKHRQNPLSPPSGGYGLLMTFVKSKGGKRKSGLGGGGGGGIILQEKPKSSVDFIQCNSLSECFPELALSTHRLLLLNTLHLPILMRTRRG